MKRIVILGAGTAGTIMANHLNHEIDKESWEIDVIDHRQEHYYQPGYLFLPFDIYEPEDIVKHYLRVHIYQTAGKGILVGNNVPDGGRLHLFPKIPYLFHD